jgi:glycosyltransferase involved in cell wall biosynthesis
MLDPTISVIIPIYKEKKILCEAIESILRQTFSDFEILLVDNNASFETLSIANKYLKEYPDKIRIVHEKTQGLASARNRGIIESKGKYIALLDGDDISLPERLELQVSILETNSSVILVSSNFDKVSYDKNNIIKKNVSRSEPSIWFETESLIKDLFKHVKKKEDFESFHFPLPSTTMFRKELALKAGLFDTKFNPRWFEDTEFFIRFFCLGSYYRYPKALVYYRKSSKEGLKIKSDQVDLKGLLIQYEKLFRSILSIFENKTSENFPVFKKIGSLWLRHISEYFLPFESGTNLSRYVLITSIFLNIKDIKTWKLLIKTYFPKKYFPHLFWFKDWEKNSIPDDININTIKHLFKL